MDIIQALIETENAGRSGWRIVNNGGALGFLNNRTSNVLFSILNDGSIGTSSNVPSNFINSYSNINIITNYYSSSNISIGSGSSSQWTTSGVKIYYNAGNIGIGTIDPITPLQIYNTTNSKLLLDATTTGTATIEFRRGIGADMQNDFRFINDTNSSLKLQYENNTDVFGNTATNLLWFSSNETIIHKNTSMYGRVGIGTVYNSTITSRTLDVFGDANISGVMTIGSLNVSCNAIITNNITSNVSLTIQNSVVPVSPLPNEIAVVPLAKEISAIPLANEIVVAGTTSGIIGADRYIIFTSGSSIFNVPTGGINCDIMMIGGGGSGGNDCGGGGGAGACIVSINQFISAGNYTVSVGAGGIANTGDTANGNVGGDSSIGSLYVAKGGGAGNGGGTGGGGGVGGCSGGSSAINSAGFNNTLTSSTNIVNSITNISPSTTTTYSVLGTRGGNAVTPAVSGQFKGGGGGGIGVSGTNGTSTICGTGGSGIYEVTINSITYNLRSHFTNNGTFGVQDGTTSNYYIGGGGGGGGWNGSGGLAYISGGRGGSGNGAEAGTGVISAAGAFFSGQTAISNTGGGGGGGAGFYARGGNGGSGIVIIRYRKPPAQITIETTSGIIGADRYISFPYTGTGSTKDYSITTTENLICDILVVGGGGGGGDPHGGGGGAGQLVLIYQATLLNGTYNVKVGKGGTGGVFQSTSATKGSNSEFGNTLTTVIAEGGGANTNTSSDKDGGSGAGGDGYTPGGGTSGAGNAITTTDLFPTATVYTRGNNGGSQGGADIGGGGGGAGEQGQSGSFTIPGKGGDGLSGITVINYDFQTNFGNFGRLEADGKYYFAGGGGGGATTVLNSSKGGGGSGGIGGVYPANLGANGVANTGSGGGGGGGATNAVGGAGGSGIVIIRYRKPPADIITETISGIVGTADRYTIFPYSGTATTKDYSFTTTESLSCDILVVGGGGGGGALDGGGGGAGACIVALNQLFSSGDYTIKVGCGGIGGIFSSVSDAVIQQSANGGNTTITNSTGTEIYRAVGGGKAGAFDNTGAASEFVGKTGGCGGGGGNYGQGGASAAGAVSSLNIVNGIQNISPSVTTTYGVYGNAGGNSVAWNMVYANANAAGGGGIGAAGANGVITRSGTGGNGLAQVTINSTTYNFKTYFAPNWSGFGVFSGGLLYIGGGGGGGAFATTTYQAKISGGLGGGGVGDYSANNSIFTDAPTDGVANTGSGGGGACGNWGANGGAGGSGLIIVRYRKLPKEIVVAGTTSTVIGTTDRCIVFPYSGSGATKEYTFTTTEPLSCDILVVGGGGGGACFGGGGGAGQVLYTTNLTISSSSALSIQVGRGGITTQPLTFAENGISTTITFGGITYTANGGGGGAGRDRSNYTSFRPAGGTGGSGGGGQAPDSSPDGPGGISNKTSYTGWISNGNAGGIGTGLHFGGGGGGAGAIGGNGINLTSGGAGGVGVNLGTIFTTSVGANGWFGGGGGGVLYSNSTTAGAGGTGGGGTGATWSPNVPNGVNGTDNTGGGGGSGGLTTSYTYGTGGKGGSGIIIIRYRIPTSTSSSSINFIRGTATDTNNDYKIGNFNREFKIVSSTSNVDTDYITITTTGAITNPTGTTSWNTGSDRRIKENIERASYDKCYENINKLELNRFNYIKGFNTVNRDKTQLGFIAQEVYDIFPKAISSQEYYSNTLSIPDLLSVDVTQINYSLYGAVKKLIEINNEKDTLLKTLDDELKTIETILNITLEPSSSNVVFENIDVITSNITVDILKED